MNSILTDHVQKVENQPSQVSADSHVISVVQRRILQNLSNDELFTISCVNKYWNYKARSLLRERGNLIAHLKSKDDNCHHLEAFASDLRQMNVIPFSGVSIAMGTGHRSHGVCQPSSTTFLDQSVILDRLRWKKFSFQSGFEVNRHCKSFLLAKEIFRQFSDRLEQLTISISDELDKVIEKIVQECYFSCLKILKLENEAFESDLAYIEFVKTLLSHAPNLQELHSQAPLKLLAKVLEESSARLVYSPWTCFDQVPEILIGALRLKKLKLQYTAEAFNVERFNSTVPRLLQTSSTHLNSMQIDAILLVPLMCYGICCRNVTELFVNIDFRQLELNGPRVLSLISDFDFTRIFPSLNKVSVECLECQQEHFLDHINSFMEQAKDICIEPLPDRAVGIKHLNVCLQESTVQFFAHMFPSIEKLSVSAHQEDFMAQPEIPFAHIWTHWVDLKELETLYLNTSHFSPQIPNLDSVFCGIFPKEVVQLRQKDEEYLKSVNIVPVQPSIACLKNLRTLKVCYSGLILEEPQSDDTSIFSKVTRFLAFQRLPGLSVTVDMNTRA